MLRLYNLINTKIFFHCKYPFGNISCRIWYFSNFFNCKIFMSYVWLNFINKFLSNFFFRILLKFFEEVILHHCNRWFPIILFFFHCLWIHWWNRFYIKKHTNYFQYVFYSLGRLSETFHLGNSCLSDTIKSILSWFKSRKSGSFTICSLFYVFEYHQVVIPSWFILVVSIRLYFDHYCHKYDL